LVPRRLQHLAVRILPDQRSRAGFDALAPERKLEIVTFRDWKKIEEA